MPESYVSYSVSVLSLSFNKSSPEVPVTFLSFDIRGCLKKVRTWKRGAASGRKIFSFLSDKNLAEATVSSFQGRGRHVFFPNSLFGWLRIHSCCGVT